MRPETMIVALVAVATIASWTWTAAAPIALQKIKQGLNHGQNSDLASALDFEAVNQNACFHSEDFMEGVKAFIEKRKASFLGK